MYINVFIQTIFCCIWQKKNISVRLFFIYFTQLAFKTKSSLFFDLLQIRTIKMNANRIGVHKRKSSQQSIYLTLSVPISTVKVAAVGVNLTVHKFAQY